MNKWLIIATILLIAGCSGTKGTGANNGIDGAPGASTLGVRDSAIVNGLNGVYSGGDGYNPGTATGYNSATNGDFYNNPQYGKNVVGGPSSSAKDRVIYFSYDSSAIDSRSQAIIDAHAKYLLKNPQSKILLEGHTDSRGSRGYNISLGENRAISVLKIFKNKGIPASQIRVISYGEENPAVPGFSEEAYQRNRRAVIQY